MAEKDLGSIPYTNVNQGTRIVDRSAEARAIGQGLDLVKKTIDEGIKGKVTADMEEAIREVESPVPEHEVVEYDPASREAYLTNKMDRLTTMIEQGKVSQKTLAEQHVKQVLNEAQSKYPWLYEDLQRRAGAVLSGSARMEQLGIDDAARTEAAKQAQSEYDAIVDHARKDWDDGGLGIPEHVDPNTAYFANLYSSRTELRNKAEEASRTVGMAIAHARIDIHNPETYNRINGALQGQYSLMASQIEGLRIRHQYDRFLEERNKGAQGDLQFIEQWKGIYAEEMKQDLLFQRQALRSLWDEQIAVIPDLLGTERGKRMEKRFMDALADYDQWLNVIEQIKDDVPGAETVISRSMAIRANDAFLELDEPGRQQLAFFTSEVGSTMLELHTALKNPSGINLANKVALSQQTYMSELFPELFDQTHPQFDAMNQAAFFKSTGALNIPPGASASEIQDRINQIQTNPNATWVIPGRNGEEETILALQNKDMHLNLLNAAKATLPTASPEFANAGLLGLTYSLSYLNDGPNAPNVQKDMLESLANGALDNAVNVSLTGNDPGMRQAFGAEAEEFYLSTNPHMKRQEIGNHYRNYRVGGVPLSEMVVIDTKALDKGNFVWVIDEDMLVQAGNQIAATAPGFMTTEGDRTRGRRKAEQKINEEMQMILNTINQQLAIEMTINKAKASGVGQMTQENDWTAFFLGAGDPAGQQQAWANHFNYTRDASVTRSR